MRSLPLDQAAFAEPECVRAAEGSEVIGNTHEQAMSAFQRDIEQWTEVIRRTGIRM